MAMYRSPLGEGFSARLGILARLSVQICRVVLEMGLQVLKILFLWGHTAACGHHQGPCQSRFLLFSSIGGTRCRLLDQLQEKLIGHPNVLETNTNDGLNQSRVLRVIRGRL